MVSTMITLPWYAPLPLETEAQEHVWGGRGTHPPKNAYPLTIQHFQLKIDIFTSKTGKHDAYHTLTDAYHEAVRHAAGPPPQSKNAYRLPGSEVGRAAV